MALQSPADLEETGGPQMQLLHSCIANPSWRKEEEFAAAALRFSH